MLSAAILFLAALAAAQEAPVFQTGTRLVQVDVVVRDRNGPVAGLTKDDFKIYVCNQQARAPRDPFGVHTPCRGKQQQIQVFHASSARSAPTSPLLLPPGAVSNRFNDRGEAVTSATIVLFDQLNTAFDHKGYERSQVAKFLRSLGENDRVAVYALGRNLHILQDFTDDPEKLVRAVTNLDSGFDVVQLYPGDDSLGRADEGLPGPMATTVNAVYGEVFDQITLQALRAIVRHMCGVPGRKNLVWLKETPQVALTAEYSRKILSLLRGANIALYPVMVRGVKSSGIFSMPGGSRVPLPSPELQLQAALRDLGASTGGAGFADAADLHDAIDRAAEDSFSAYTLGFYPARSDLDGKIHQISVALSNKVASRGRVEMHYRNEFLAAAQEPRPDRASLADLFSSPLDSNAIGLSAAASRDGVECTVDLAVDLAGVQVERKDGRWAGSLLIAARLEPALETKPDVRIVTISLDAAQLQTALSSGYVIRMDLTGIAENSTSLHVVVQDPATGAAGSLRVPLRQ